MACGVIEEPAAVQAGIEDLWRRKESTTAGNGDYSVAIRDFWA
jgi:hypothetical protein